MTRRNELQAGGGPVRPGGEIAIALRAVRKTDGKRRAMKRHL
jgi:hypothetical protein